MSDILEEIQELSNKFSNLFEVDDLGQPAMDVPPSQNKIKRDRKTKDGKVELVSVEDELFPYEGNKREQYRQKILDTINNMIQGKATLEDLLQIVRQKKAPLKEAMELMEDIRSAIEKKHGKPEYYSGRSPWQVGREPANKSAKLTQKANDIKEKEALQAAERELDKDRPDLKDAHPAKKNYKVADYYGQIMARRNGKAPLKEAVEVLESIINEKHVFPKKAVEDGNKKYLEADKKNNEATRLARKGFEKLNKKIKELESKGIDTDVDIEPGVTYGNGPKKEYQQALKTADALHNAQREADREETKARNNQRKLRAEGLKGVVMRHFDYVPTKKGDSFNIKKVLDKNEALKEAVEILEAIKDQVKNHQKYHGGAATFSYKGNDYSYSPEKGLRKEGKTRDDRNPVKQIVDTENKEFDDVRKYKYDLERQSRTINKKLNKEVKELEKTEGKGAFPGKTNDTIKKLIDMSTVNSSNRADADKHFTEVNAKQKKLANDAKGVKYEAKDFYNTKKSDSYGVKPTVKTSEALKEALEIMEAVINEVSERTKIDAYKKRANQSKFVGDIAKDTAKWHMDRGAYGPAIEVLKKADAAQKKEFKHRLNTMLHDKAFGQDAYNKAEKELHDEWKDKKDIKEALSLTEEIINEVSVKKWKEAAKNSIEGRKEAASDASDRFGEVVYPFRGEVNDPGHKLGNAWDKAEQRADRAEQLAKNLPDSNKSATKLKQAAKKVVDKRDKDNEEAVDKLQGAVDKLKGKPYDERTDKDYSDLAKVQNEWVGKQKKENQARNLVGKPERRPEKNSEGKHELKEQGFIDRSNEA